ncbi:MAG: VOC family protein [Pseudomonadales bacterium]
MPSPVDHLIFATPQLQEGVDYLQSLLGLRAISGGAHPGLGTCNALIALGQNCYLEVIGPNPEQKNFDGERPFGIDALEGCGQLAGWAARRAGLASFRNIVNPEVVVVSDVIPLSRQTPEGELLEWQLSFLSNISASMLSVLPFFIDWGDTPHPSTQCVGQAQLKCLEIEYPQAANIMPVIDTLELEVTVTVTTASKPGLRAVIECPKGDIELRTS